MRLAPIPAMSGVAGYKVVGRVHRRKPGNIIVLERQWKSEAVKRFLEPGRMDMVKPRKGSGVWIGKT